MRARRREINIFNMSLLDILCGALGAFCFMMLVALPYYKPPGTEKSLQEAQAETQRLLDELDAMKQRMRDPQAVAEMENLIRRLEAQIKALQGQVNILSSEKQQLTGQVQQLGGQVTQLTAQAGQLSAQVDQLTGRVNQLNGENQRLTAQDDALRKRVNKLQERSPFLVLAQTNGHQPLDLFLYTLGRTDNRSLPGTDGPRSAPPFDPSRQWNGTTWPGDVRLVAAKNGATAWMMRDVPAGTQVKVYAKVKASDLAAGPALVDGMVAGTGQARIDLGDGSNVMSQYNPVPLPTVTLTASRPWIFVGTIESPEMGKVKFTPATEQEREAEWKALASGPDRTPPQ